MPFTTPTPWRAAIASRDLKSLLPTELSSAELMRIPAELRERAMFSAKVTNANFLQQVNNLVTRIVSPETIKDPVTGVDRPVQPGESMDPATARLLLKQQLQSIAYQPDPEKRGGIEDLSSNVRLNLIVRTNSEMAQGFGHWRADQDPARLDAFPAQELYRLEDRVNRRPWGQIWNNAISSLGDSTSAQPVAAPMTDDGMFALKNDPIWTEISAFGIPYPPYDFGSGMWVRDVSYSDALDLGLVGGPDDVPDPDSRGFNDDLQADLTALAPALQEAVSASMEGIATIVDGVLTLIGKG